MNKELVITETSRNKTAEIMDTLYNHKEIRNLKRSKIINGLRFVVKGNLILV